MAGVPPVGRAALDAPPSVQPRAAIKPLPASAAPADRDAIRRAAIGLEAALFHQMLEAMEKAQLDEGFFGQGAAAGTQQTQFELLLSQALAERGPLGLADQIADQLSRRPVAPALTARPPAAHAGLPGPLQRSGTPSIPLDLSSPAFRFFQEGAQVSPLAVEKEGD